MNWDALGSLAELFGAIGVVGSLLFLGFETRKATAASRASLTADAIKEIGHLNDFAIANPRLRDLITKSMSPGLEVSEFDEEEWKELLHFARGMFMKVEGMLILHEQGLIDDELVEIRGRFLAGLMRFPVWQRYWQQDRENSVYTKRFIDFIESAERADHTAPKRMQE